jgi:hypothetical protein
MESFSADVRDPQTTWADLIDRHHRVYLSNAANMRSLWLHYHPQQSATTQYLVLQLWQAYLVEELDSHVVPRRIFWVWSRSSRTGKTTFADWCNNRYKMVCPQDFDRSTLTYLIAHHDPRVIWFNLPRATTLTENILSTLEWISDVGPIVSSKYVPTPARREVHVVVTANVPPPHDELPSRCEEVHVPEIQME